MMQMHGCEMKQSSSKFNGLKKISKNVRKYAAEQGIAEEQSLKKDMQAKSKKVRPYT